MDGAGGCAGVFTSPLEKFSLKPFLCIAHSLLVPGSSESESYIYVQRFFFLFSMPKPVAVVNQTDSCELKSVKR